MVGDVEGLRRVPSSPPELWVFLLLGFMGFFFLGFFMGFSWDSLWDLVGMVMVERV